MLHIAPAQPFYKHFGALENVDYITADLESPLADFKVDLTKLPFDDYSFDIIFCNHVLEHIEDDKTAMKELFRVMKKGGWGIFQVPLDHSIETTFEDSSIISQKDRATHFGQYDHVRVYAMDYFDRLRGVGFGVNPIKCADMFTAKSIEQYALDPDEILTVCHKK
ncbi:methyltransferase domain protein [Elysia marginata]|uniref:Methyltransferase domain protein n=1 Tax=Elysia marginata TaxID=1093978 RepID=A0AAV4FT33_9GAST|nr:methyltransferase domain protein [Elysia marginata]